MWKPLLLKCSTSKYCKRSNAMSRQCHFLLYTNNVTSYWNVNFYMTSFVSTVKLGKQLQLKRNTCEHKAIIFLFYWILTRAQWHCRSRFRPKIPLIDFEYETYKHQMRSNNFSVNRNIFSGNTTDRFSTTPNSFLIDLLICFSFCIELDIAWRRKNDSWSKVL